MFWNPQLKTFFRFLETNQKEEPKDTTTAATTGWQYEGSTEKQPDEESTAPETEQKDESSTSGTSIKINNKKLYSNKL